VHPLAPATLLQNRKTLGFQRPRRFYGLLTDNLGHVTNACGTPRGTTTQGAGNALRSTARQGVASPMMEDIHRDGTAKMSQVPAGNRGPKTTQGEIILIRGNSVNEGLF